jgi:hypothetical protein
MTVSMVGPGMTNRMAEAATKASQSSMDTIHPLHF